MDEIWQYVGKKQRRAGAHPELGDQYTYIALDATRKAIISYATGKRNAATTQTFANDLAERVINAPQISSDGFEPYVKAVENAFGSRVRYGQIVKHYRAEPGPNAARRYSPGYIVAVSTRDVFGQPERISTSYVERSNLSLRMASRRFTRLTNGFSKKLENHKAAVGLYVAHYNLCRVHETLRVTPAMALGVTDHIWSIAELMEAAMASGSPAPSIGPGHAPQPGRQVGRFRVIDGDRG
jgi:IS1 family transposase